MRASKQLHLRLRAALLAASLAAPAYADDLRVLRVTPAGDDVATADQVVIHFDRAMVPLGRMQRTAAEVPAQLLPDPGCQWRWLDAQALACQLPQQLQMATRYTVRIATPLQALDGTALARPVEHQFVTERPRVAYAYVLHWLGPGEPVVRARFSQPVSAAAIRATLRFGDVPALAEPPEFDAETPFYSPEGEARQDWWLRPERALELNRPHALKLQPGLRAELGLQASLQPQKLAEVHTFPALRLQGLSCQQSPTEVGAVALECPPLEGVNLVFTAPVSVTALKGLLRITPDPGRGQTDPDYDPWAGLVDGRRHSGPHQRGQVYPVRLPFQLQAETEYHVEIAAGLSDQLGRRMDAPLSLRFRTGARSPRLVFEHEHAVIESGLDSEVPAVVTNLQRIDARFDRLTASGLQTNQTRTLAVAPTRNLAFAMPLDVRGMLGVASGAVRGGLSTEPRTDQQPREFFAAVTPWQVHAKLGHSNLLVWVTAMADGQPVADAEVGVLDQFGTGIKASARTATDGTAQLPGAAELDPDLQRVWGREPGPLWLRVQRGDELAVMPLSQDFVVDTWRASREQIYAWRRERHGHLKAWGTTAQGVYRGGDTVQYKLYVRDDAGRSLAPAQAGEYRLQVFDPAGSVVHERKAQQLSDFGALQGEFKLGTRAAVGWYRFVLTPAFAKDQELEPLRVLVSDFVPAPFRVSAELRTPSAQPRQTVDVVIGARLHGGGPFAAAPARLNARIRNRALQPQPPLAAGYQYDTLAAGGRSQDEVLTQSARLDAAGEWTQVLNLADGDVLYGELVVEGSVQDDRGRSIAAQTAVPYVGRDRYIGLRSREWVGRSGRPTAAEMLVIDPQGHPLADVPYYVKVERKITRGARVKGAGNAYITRYLREWQRVETCQGRSSVEGMSCSFTPEAAGEYRMIAMVRDSHDRLHQTQQWLYVEGPQAVLWEDTPDYSLDLRLDQAEYRSGQTARILVKNPFPGARALITVERYGVLDHWVQTLEGSTPMIRVPIKPEYFPGAYVSVVVTSPRVAAAPAAAGRLDLGKPTFRMGYTPLPVRDAHREIAVAVQPARETYKPGERVRVDLRAQPRVRSSTSGTEPIELAVAVLDEAVFDLIQSGTDYFDPLKGFTSLEPLDLANYAMLTRLVGRQKFEKKGANAGGDGGAALALRSVDKFVAYWNPALRTDAQGRAAIEFRLPDNLSGWRVLALAATPSDRMGLGQGRFSVSKATELRPAMPNQVALGDRFEAGFTVLNRDSAVRTLKAELAVTGGASGRHAETFQLQPYERRTLYLPVKVVSEENLQFTASAGDAADQDALRHEVAVKPRPLHQLAADYSSVTAGHQHTQQLRLPDTAERGELRVSVSPSVIGNLGGAFGYLRDYPYSCWEQQLSRALMAAHYLNLQPRLGGSVNWPEAAGLPAQILARAGDFQAPAGGMAFWLPRDGYQSPYLSAYTALAFAWLQQMGYTPPPDVSARLNDYLQSLLRDDIPASGYESAEARAQVRAVALAALAQQGQLPPGELQRYRAQLPRMGVFGQALYLQAAAAVAGAEPARDEALGRLLSRAQLSAGRMVLQEDGDSRWPQQLGSELRSNCAALSALMVSPGTTGKAAALDELPTRLARAITQARGSRVHWENTQENVFCSRALLEYAQRYERPDLLLTAAVALDGQRLASVQIAAGRNGAISKALTAESVDKDHVLSVTATGTGRAYVDTTLSYVERPEVAQPVSAGLSLERRYFVQRAGQWQVLDSPMTVRRGERIKVELDVSVPGAMNYLVVDDPVPGGLEPINPDLANAASIEEAAIDLNGSAYPYPFYHRELRFDAVRHYADAIGSGRYRLSWIGQAVATGEFLVDVPRAVQMYDPDVYASGAPQRLVVEAAP